jgi:hypothetical protein
MVDVISERVMQSIDLEAIHPHDPDLADYFVRMYASNAYHAHAHQSMIPSMRTWWWGSREQVVFLQVLAALLWSSTADSFRPLRDEYARAHAFTRDAIPSLMVSLSANDFANESIVDADADADACRREASSLLPALMYCPGPWDEKSLDLISSHRHDDLSLVAACVIVGARWCRKNHSRIRDLSVCVNARTVGRLCTTRRGCCCCMFNATSVQEVRKELVKSYTSNL